MESEFPSNSSTHKPGRTEKSAPPKLEKVVTGEVVRRKKSLGRRFRENFVGAESRGVGDYVLFDVALPALKDLIFDMFTEGLQRKLYDDIRPGSGRRYGSRYGSPSTNNGFVSYQRYGSSSPSQRPPERVAERRVRKHREIGDILLPNKVEAEEVIDRLMARVEEFGMATIPDLYDLIDEPWNYTDEKYGWTDLREARVIRARGGYLLDLPEAEPIN